MTANVLRITRPEWLGIGLMTAVGAMLRLWSLDRLGLSHFDEGMYAMAALWVTLPGGLAEIDPSASLYAPPGYVTLVGLAYMIGGFTDLAPILVSIAAGIATIPLASLVAWQTFGPGAGVAAAALAALSGPHIAFSRMALTDSLFLLMWLLAMATGARFLAKPTFGRAVALGVAVGLAQNVKYNGGLAGIIVAIAAGAGFLIRHGGTRPARNLALLVLAAAIAGLMYLPWALFVEGHVGYAKLAAHHRGYSGGLSDWPGHLMMQLGQAAALSPNGIAGIGWLIGCLGYRFVVGPVRGIRGIFAVLASTLWLAAIPSTPWWLAVAWSPWLLTDPVPSRRLLGAWIVVLSLITPLYHPYARLWLPLQAAGWIVASGALLEIVGRASRESRGVGRFGPAILALAMVLALVQSTGFRRGPRPLTGLLGPTDSFRRHIAEASPDPERAHVVRLLLLGRPHASFYTVLDGRVPFRKMSGLDQVLEEAQPGNWALVDDVMLRQEGDFESARRRLLDRYEPVGGWEETLSPPTLLDVSPEAAFGETAARSSRWTLLRPKP